MNAIAAFSDVTEMQWAPPLDFYTHESIPLIGADDVWAPKTAGGLGLTGAGIGVAVVDSGIYAPHPDLQARVVKNLKFTADFTVEQQDTDTTSGHGTHVAGTIAGDGTASRTGTSDDLGGFGYYTGVAPGASLVGLGVGDGRSIIWALQAFNWIADNHRAHNIRVVSNSWGNIGNVPLGSAIPTRDATRRGQTVAFAAGNGATNTNSSTVFPPGGQVEDPCKCKTPDSNPSMTSPYGGPSWVMTVGATSPINGQAHWWHSIPVDVSSFGSKWRAAAYDGVQREQNRDFGGTSCATPITSGVLSTVIERARQVFGDTTAGQRPGQVVAAAAPGPMFLIQSGSSSSSAGCAAAGGWAASCGIISLTQSGRSACSMGPASGEASSSSAACSSHECGSRAGRTARRVAPGSCATKVKVVQDRASDARSSIPGWPELFA